MIDQTVDRQRARNVQLGIEAGRWLLQLDDPDPESVAPFATPHERDTAFRRWLVRSPEHLKVFLETCETYQRLGCMDPDRGIEVQKLVRRVRNGPCASKGSRRRGSRRRAPTRTPCRVLFRASLGARPSRRRLRRTLGPRNLRLGRSRNAAWRPAVAAAAAVMIMSVSIFLLAGGTPSSVSVESASLMRSTSHSPPRRWTYMDAYCSGPNGLIRRCDDEG